MATFLDIRTLSVVMGATIFALGISMVYYNVNRRTYPGFGAWTTATVLVSLAFFLVALRRVLPDFFTIVISNALIYSGFLLFYLGFKATAGQKVKPYLHFAGVFLLSFVLVPIFTYVTPSVNIRTSLLSFVGAVYFLLSTRVLVKEIQSDLIKLNKLFVASMILTSALLAFRGVFFLLPGNTLNSYMSKGAFHGSALLAVIILALFFVIGLMHLNSQMLERELRGEQKHIKDSEEKYRRFVDQSLQGLVIAQNDPLRLTFVSKPMEAILGYSRGELENFDPRQLKELVHPEDREMFFQNFKDRISGKEAPLLYEIRIGHKTKGTRWVAVHSSRIEHENAPTVHAVFLDVTKRKRAQEALRKSEEQLARSKKMESLGLLAGGVAHDLNNILSGIVSYPELLLLDLPRDSPLRKPIETIQESGKRASDVVADLLTIARGVATGKTVLNLNTMVKGYLSSAEHQNLEKHHSSVEFKTDLEESLLNMSGSPTHIKKTLMNMILNAAEATEKSGTVRISTRNRYMDESLKGYDDVRQGEYAVLSVSDEGTGITPEDLERIFEPFYSKKMMGRSGTGLGLAVVWNTVQDHKGYINVNTDGNGTVFELYFPVTREVVANKHKEISLEVIQGHGEKILVVDDEEKQREIACAMLSRLGYATESVASGEEAIIYVKVHAVDLLVLDMAMPKGINGRETYEEIIKIRPGQKAVIASGYAKTKEVDMAQGSGAGKFIRKPYILEKIGAAVKDELA